MGPTGDGNNNMIHIGCLHVPMGSKERFWGPRNDLGAILLNVFLKKKRIFGRIGKASSQVFESRFGISVKSYPRNLFLVQKTVSSIFRPRVQTWVIFWGQKWGGSGIIVQKWGGAKRKKKIRKKQNVTTSLIFACQKCS